MFAARSFPGRRWGEGGEEGKKDEEWFEDRNIAHFNSPDLVNQPFLNERVLIVGRKPLVVDCYYLLHPLQREVALQRCELWTVGYISNYFWRTAACTYCFFKQGRGCTPSSAYCFFTRGRGCTPSLRILMLLQIMMVMMMILMFSRQLIFLKSSPWSRNQSKTRPDGRKRRHK